MKERLIRVTYFLFLSVTLALFVCACSKANRVEVLKYKKNITKQRADKDRFFGESPNSPLLPVQRMSFKGLKYYKPDFKYKIKAIFTPQKSAQSFKIQTSSGRERLYIVKGRLDFAYKGEKLFLMAYQEKAQASSHPNSLFIPFTDLTSGQQSYGGGRYIEINSPGQQAREVVLDFNLAFNPYCAYNHNYSCPIPPTENHLDIAINAGERKFH
jgi:uncharacterized protein (DUF1684 family)